MNLKNAAETQKKKKVIFIFLLTFGLEVNLIEGQWHQIKVYEIAGKIF